MEGGGEERAEGSSQEGPEAGLVTARGGAPRGPKQAPVWGN